MHTRQGRLIIYYASEMHEGLYEIRAQSHYQDAYARTRIKVYKGFSIQFDPPTHHPKTSISLGLFKISKETQPKKKNCKNDPKISLFKNIDNFVAPSIRTLNPRLAEKFKKNEENFPEESIRTEAAWMYTYYVFPDFSFDSYHTLMAFFRTWTVLKKDRVCFEVVKVVNHIFQYVQCFNKTPTRWCWKIFFHSIFITKYKKN